MLRNYYLEIKKRYSAYKSGKNGINTRMVKKVINYAFYMLFCYFMYKYFSRLNINFSSIRLDRQSILCFLFAFILQCITLRLSCYVWSRILKSLGVNLPYKTNAEIYNVTRLARYIPGKIWSIVGRARLYSKYGVSSLLVTTGVIQEVIAILISSLILSYPIIIRTINLYDAFKGYKVLFYLVSFASSIALLWPNLVNTVLFHIAKKLKKEVMIPKVSFLNWLGMNSVYVLIWSLKGIAYYVLIRAFANNAIDTLFYTISILAFSWFLGFISFFAPNGLGVKESVSVYYGIEVLNLEPEIAIMVAILSRVVLTFAELLMGITYCYRMKKSEQN